MKSGGRLAAVIQARMGSSRLPGKVMLTVRDRTLLQRTVERAKRALSLDSQVCIATSSSSDDDLIEELGDALRVPVFRGSENNVLERFAGAAQELDIDTVVRVTADNPLVGPDVIDFMVAHHRRSDAHLTTSYYSKSFPNGTVVSVIERSALKSLRRLLVPESIKEHIVGDLEFLQHHLVVESVIAPPRWSRYDLRYCVDTRSDLEVVSAIAEAFEDQRKDPTTEEIIAFLDTNPEILTLNVDLAGRGY